MEFPTSYKILNKNSFFHHDYEVKPIRYEDRFSIMKWRNEQMYHLRQNEVLTNKKQEAYFQNNVSPLFKEENPTQLLFSYLKNGECIGYGGLVHINWESKTAEVSFIMDTKLEKSEFELHWSTFLFLLKKIAFDQVKFNSIYTYAYNLRPHLYPILEKNGFVLKKILKKEIKIEEDFVDVYIHECQSPVNQITLRHANENDITLIFNWSNDELVRSQSFNSGKINFEEHTQWFRSKLSNNFSTLYIIELANNPIGLVRFEKDEDHSVVGLLVDPKYRGKGFSSYMLIKSCEKYFQLNTNPILAYIKKTNIASIKAFEKAGFSFLKEVEVKENSAFLYKLINNEK